MTTILDWISKIPPNINDTGLKLLIYLVGIFAIITAIIVYFATKGEKRSTSGLTLEELDFDISRPIANIAPDERIEILNIEKEKFIAARKALTDAYKRKKLSDNIFERLSVRYASDLKKIEDEIEKTQKEKEVSQLEEELKKMQGDYLSKIAGESSPAPKVTPPGSTAPPAPKVTPPSAIARPPAPPTASAQSSDEGDLFAKSTSIAALRKEMLKELDRLKTFMSEQSK